MQLFLVPYSFLVFYYWRRRLYASASIPVECPRSQPISHHWQRSSLICPEKSWTTVAEQAGSNPGKQVSHSWKLSRQVCRESGGSGIDVRPVLHSVQESHGEVRTRLGWVCQVAERLHILGMWFRQAPLGVPPHTADSVCSHWKQQESTFPL